MTTGDTRGKADYTVKTTDKVRYRDTDRQGHVNNAVFSSFLETGRVELLYDPQQSLTSQDASFVIASLKIEFLGEITWPGEVEIGTRVARVGRSSVSIEQGVFQNDVVVARAETVIVQIGNATRKSTPLSDAAIEALNSLM